MSMTTGRQTAARIAAFASAATALALIACGGASPARAATEAGGIAVLAEGVVSLRVPAGMRYHGRDEIAAAFGNADDMPVGGAVLPADVALTAEDALWVEVELAAHGHVKMTELPDAGLLLDGTRAAARDLTRQLARQGGGVYEVLGWARAPRLDPEAHVLRWAEDVRAGVARRREVHAFAYAFGRTVNAHVRAVAPIEEADAAVAAVDAVVDGIVFLRGERYRDFDIGADDVAAFAPADAVRGVFDPAAEAIADGLAYRTGRVALGDGLATMDLSPAYRYLDPDGAKRVLTDLWGNPSDTADDMLGMVFPADVEPTDEAGWGVVVRFLDRGYTDDADAKTIDYDALLAELKEQAAAHNDERVAAGHPRMELVGWARAPSYDPASHIIIWAREFAVGDNPDHTLNYDVRILGRRGVLSLNAVAALDDVSAVRAGMQEVARFTSFEPGHRYEDYVPGTDAAAEAGLAALVVGAAAKSGLFKGVLAGLVAAKKALFVLAAAVLAVLARAWRALLARLRSVVQEDGR